MMTATRWMGLPPATFTARWFKFPPGLVMKPSAAWTNILAATKRSCPQGTSSSILCPSPKVWWSPCKLGERISSNPDPNDHKLFENFAGGIAAVGKDPGPAKRELPLGGRRKLMKNAELHRTHRIGWLRAAVLGANDGIVSTASLIVGVAAAEAGRNSVLVAGLAGLVAGAMSMAAGEYVSVSSQSDTENADLEREREELATDLECERAELAAIYVQRGLDAELAMQVATQLMNKDALGAHARDELGISDTLSARPVQAAFTSALTFSVGAALPLLAALVAPPTLILPVVAGVSLVVLTSLGALSARAGGAPILRASLRVVFWGALAMGLTAGVGKLFGAAM